MKTRTICLVITLLLTTGVALAQPEIEWERTYGGDRQDKVFSSLQLPDSTLMFAGYTSSYGAGREDFCLFNTSLNGDSITMVTFGGESKDECIAFIPTNDNGFALAGKTNSFRPGADKILLVMLNEEYDSLNYMTYGGDHFDECRSILQTDDGGFVLAGYTGSFGNGEQDFWLVRTNTDGDSLWSKTYGGETAEYCNSIIKTSEDGYALAGMTSSFGAGRFDGYVVVTDSEGELIWSAVIGGEGYDEFTTIIETEDGDYILAGKTTSYGSGDEDFWLIKLDYQGNSLWSRTFGGQEDDGCTDLLVTVDGGLVLGGVTKSFGEGGRDFWLVKTSFEGDSVWSISIGSELDESAESLIQTTTGEFIVSGSKREINGPPSDFYLVKTTPDPVSVRNSAPVHPSSLILHPSYPNPFNSMVTIPFVVGAQGLTPLQLAIFDPLGRRIADLIPNGTGDFNRRVGSHSAVWNANAFPAGSYLVRLESGSQSLTQPILLVK